MLDNESELLWSVVFWHLQKELNGSAESAVAKEPALKPAQPWPERRRFWHRRWPVPAKVPVAEERAIAPSG